MRNAGNVNNTAGGGASQHIQEQIGQEEMAQVIDSQLGLTAILRQALGTHHHT